MRKISFKKFGIDVDNNNYIRSALGLENEIPIFLIKCDNAQFSKIETNNLILFKDLIRINGIPGHGTVFFDEKNCKEFKECLSIEMVKEHNISSHKKEKPFYSLHKNIIREKINNLFSKEKITSYLDTDCTDIFHNFINRSSLNFLEYPKTKINIMNAIIYSIIGGYDHKKIVLFLLDIFHYTDISL